MRGDQTLNPTQFRTHGCHACKPNMSSLDCEPEKTNVRMHCTRQSPSASGLGSHSFLPRIPGPPGKHSCSLLVGGHALHTVTEKYIFLCCPRLIPSFLPLSPHRWRGRNRRCRRTSCRTTTCSQGTRMPCFASGGTATTESARSSLGHGSALCL